VFVEIEEDGDIMTHRGLSSLGQDSIRDSKFEKYC